jgi:hypothetical protein
MKSLIPEGEERRLAVLREYGILDTEPEQEYDDLAHLAAMICGTPMSTGYGSRQGWVSPRWKYRGRLPSAHT